MNNYEFLYIVPSKYSDTEIEKINKKIIALVEKEVEKIIKIDYWGKRKLSYQIKQFRYGYYTLIVFSAKPQSIGKLTKLLNIENKIIRFQIVKEIKQNAKQRESLALKKTETKKIETATKDLSPSKEKKPEETIEKISTNKKEKEEDSKKITEKEDKKKKKNISIDEIDKKLDELLEDTV